MSDLYERKNPHRLYRDKENAILAGVCAGLADYFGLNRKGLRIIVAISTFFFVPFVVLTYIILAIILPTKPEDLYQDESQEKFWRGVSMAPSDVFGNLNHRFRELDVRLQKMEAYVTSKEFDIDRELGRNSR
jgi:phage shock protein C